MSRLWIGFLLLLSATSMVWCQELRLDWRYPTGGRIRSEPAAAPDGAIYALSEDGYLYSFSERGRIEHQTNLAGLPADSLSVGPDGTVYAGLSGGKLLAVNPRGQIIWRFDAGSSLLGNPAIADDGTIFAGTEKGTLSSIALNGALEWQVTLPARMTLPPLLDAQETLYLGGADRRLYALSRWGRFLWSTPLPGAPLSAAVTSGGTLYAVTSGGTVVAVSPQGNLVWQTSPGEADFGPVISRGRLFVAARDGMVEALSRSGQRLWRTQLGPKLEGSLALGQGRLYVMGPGSSVTVLNTASGARLAATKVASAGGMSMTRSGELLIGGADWLVYSYAGAHFAPDAEWPLRSADARHSRHGVGRFSEATALRLLSQIPEYLALDAQFEPSSRAALDRLLEEVRQRIDSGSLGKSRWYVRRILEKIAGVGILNPVVEGSIVVNDFPTIRAQAAGLLGRLPALTTRGFLIRLLRSETDPLAAAFEIEALGKIGSDGDGEATRAIAEAVARFTAGGGPSAARVAQSAVDALAGISRYEGELPDISGRLALLRIYRGPFGADLRNSALALLFGR